MSGYDVAVLTISDRSFRGEREDVSGPALVDALIKAGFDVKAQAIVPDEFDTIKIKLLEWVDTYGINLIITTGGTGISPRDITPEVTLAIIEKEAPGIAEAMRYESMKLTPHAMLSRSVAGIRKSSLIINLPGSPKAALENLAVILPILPHALALLLQRPHAETHHNFKNRD